MSHYLRFTLDSMMSALSGQCVFTLSYSKINFPPIVICHFHNHHDTLIIKIAATIYIFFDDVKSPQNRPKFSPPVRSLILANRIGSSPLSFLPLLRLINISIIISLATATTIIIIIIMMIDMIITISGLYRFHCFSPPGNLIPLGPALTQARTTHHFCHHHHHRWHQQQHHQHHHQQHQ